MIIENIREKVTRDSNYGLAYFYCDYKDSATQVATNVLRSLIKHAAIQNEESFTDLQGFMEKYELDNRLITSPDLSQLLSLFCRMLGRYDAFFIVIDALDESLDANRHELLKMIEDLCTNISAVKLICTSREEVDIQTALAQFSKTQIVADVHDLEMFVASEIEMRIRNGRLRIDHAEVKDKIIDKLSHQADGM